jgi:UDP-N-acetylmuramoylalanine--D-glutamate ligase
MKAFQSITKVVKGSSMDEAVKTAQTFATKGDVVLLSPACASFDWFEDYKHRGRVFKECVNRLE